jgi:two-component system, OmpR family, response regulator VicR
MAAELNLVASKSLIFVVEDEIDIAKLIAHTLENSGFATRIFPDGALVLEEAERLQPKLILLDLMLPGADGMEILRNLESLHRTRGIRKIILSARGAEVDKVRALELGADDYVTKPFSPRELVLRIRAVLRALPGESEQHRIVEVGDLVADLDAKTVSVHNSELNLTSTEYNVLVYFMIHAGQMLTRERLLADLWGPGASIEDKRIVDVYVRRLRERIEKEPSDPQRLVTRRGGGYTLLDPDRANRQITA